jgi:hypothetical protein
MEDLPLICRLFEEAIAFQEQHHFTGWKNYDQAFLVQDIHAQQLFKVMHGHEVAGIFSVCYADQLIWRDKEQGDAVYLHRIVLNRQVKGVKLFPLVLAWSKDRAIKMNRRFIRMDTWAGNQPLIKYYQGYGFSFLENYTTPDTPGLPVQHRLLQVALLQLELPLIP